MKLTEQGNFPGSVFWGSAGSVGTGMEAIHLSGEAEVAAIADICPENAQAAAQAVPTALIVGSLEELLGLKLDGIVIATPSAMPLRPGYPRPGPGLGSLLPKAAGPYGAGDRAGGGRPPEGRPAIIGRFLLPFHRRHQENP